MTFRPLIGLIPIPCYSTRPATFSYVAAHYDAIAAAGGIPVVVPPLEDDQMLAAIMDRVDGFVLIGGTINAATMALCCMLRSSHWKLDANDLTAG